MGDSRGLGRTSKQRAWLLHQCLARLSCRRAESLCRPLGRETPAITGTSHCCSLLPGAHHDKPLGRAEVAAGALAEKGFQPNRPPFPTTLVLFPHNTWGVIMRGEGCAHAEHWPSVIRRITQFLRVSPVQLGSDGGLEMPAECPVSPGEAKKAPHLHIQTKRTAKQTLLS
ncbi:lipid A export permease/ATP-binding protein MsbA [Platysternon megacephalum]|uniref:Lipid A export permease/ATP-binding protein MsbA n=1 Tax=Platysternon megacephalum TaxID=55544 RepID=A0A4D9DAT7_9SAUR|nr:lipid A export permease/ATP-binding protein MsbA [Platysternon megacephalum]